MNMVSSLPGGNWFGNRLKLGLLCGLAFVLCLSQPLAADDDPFADLSQSGQTISPTGLGAVVPSGPQRRMRGSEFFKKELLTHVSLSDRENPGKPYIRQSLGFEYLRRFADEVSTVASFDFQGRLVYRTGFLNTPSDMEGGERENWFFEYHNVYLDLFNALDPILSPEARKGNLGRFNARVGRFYLPFGLNLQTDTHGTLLQLSNDRNFGFERDWYAGLWGSVNPRLNYDLYYLMGSGYEAISRGQKGLIGSRISLANRYLYDHGLEGGIAVMSGQRISSHAVMRSPGVALQAANDIVDTLRFGLDARFTSALPNGTLTWTSELSTGRDEDERILTQLYQVEFLKNTRRWGATMQYRRFWQDIHDVAGMAMGAMPKPGNSDASVIGEYTRYYRFSPGNDDLHWVKVNVERRLEDSVNRRSTMYTLQYYRYW